jgi:3-deoxy-D-manno-octulosonate 8-phosphate phosphatase KdsC-like HAD superfamily phosphatase
MKQSMMKVAICYDFDGTLAPGNMQEYGFMKALGTTPKSFWNKSDALSVQQHADKNLCYMYTMLKEAEAKQVSFRKEDLEKYGKDIVLFKGVENWFSRINAFAKKNGIELQHYLLSSGLKEIVSGLPISKEFTRVYACSFMYDANGVAFWPAQVVNYTTKTQYLYRINKGCLDETDISVNEKMSHDLRAIPFSRMLYIGDGLTDVPCMSTLHKFGGQALAVYRPHTKNGITNAQKLLKGERVDNIAPADYSEGSRIDIIIKAWLIKLKAERDMKS